MASFRRNHGGDRKNSTSGYVRAAIFAICVVGLMYLLQGSIGMLELDAEGESTAYSIPTETDIASRVYLPQPTNPHSVVHHSNYSLEYSEEHEQALWVAYELTEAELKAPNVDRTDYFHVDTKISTRSARHSDYTRSGYTRGHLAPAGDMAHSVEAMEESFYMSNISPQRRAFNSGIWKELEEQVRDWAYKADRLYITTGGVLIDEQLPEIGKANKIAVPKYFYKAILDVDEPDRRGIAFIIPNKRCEEPLQHFALSINEAEQKIGLDLFADVLDDELEQEIESEVDTSAWSFSEKRYLRRINHWNKQ